MPTTRRSDRDLVGAVIESGDEQAFRELYRRHTPRLLGFVSRLLAGANSEDEDVVQETWTRACENLKHLEWRSTFSTWLLGIGLNVVRDSMRRRLRSRTVPAEMLRGSPEQEADHEIRVDLDRAIRMLPDEYRMVLVLHDVEGMTHNEISKRLEIPIGTTKSQLFRARRLIREWFSERNGVRR